MKCRFGCDEAHVYVTLDHGFDRKMFLCMKHWAMIEPLGSVHADNLEAAFLAFMDAQIEHQPDSVVPADDAQLERIAKLVAEVKVEG